MHRKQEPALILLLSGFAIVRRGPVRQKIVLCRRWLFFIVWSIYLAISTAHRQVCWAAMLSIVQAETPEQVAIARELIMEYAARLGVDLCFQGFEEEMRTLPGKYAPPAGRLLLALWNEKPAGVIALRTLGENTESLCEMKRLFVRPEFRGHGIGRLLAERVIAEAAAIGYRRMRLDTMPGKMDSAIAMYRELGFTETPPYYDTPVGQTLFMELALHLGQHVKK